MFFNQPPLTWVLRVLTKCWDGLFLALNNLVVTDSFKNTKTKQHMAPKNWSHALLMLEIDKHHSYADRQNLLKEKIPNFLFMA